MAKETKCNCFIIMPITLPDHLVDKYNRDNEHFSKVLHKMFMPAIDAIGYEPVPPTSKGSHIIQSDILKKIENADLVLCDMAALNPNVFFELGIRTALDGPVSLVKDNLTGDVPFDTSMINYHTYNAKPTWQLDEEIKKLKDHLLESIASSNGHNNMWEKLGISLAKPTQPDNVTDAKIDLLTSRLDQLLQNKSTIESLSFGYRQDSERIFNKDAEDLVVRVFVKDFFKQKKIELKSLEIDTLNKTLFLDYGTNRVDDKIMTELEEHLRSVGYIFKMVWTNS